MPAGRLVAGTVAAAVGNLIPDTVADGLMDPGLLPALTEAVADGYREVFARRTGMLRLLATWAERALAAGR